MNWGAFAVLMLLVLGFLLVEPLLRSARPERSNRALDALLSRLKRGPPPMALLLMVATALLVLSSDPAVAQSFGGGGGFLDGIRQFAMGPVLTTVLVFAVIGVAIALMASHHYTSALFILAGAWLWANADTIAGMLH